MTISPLRIEVDGYLEVVGYQSSPVFTTCNGRRTLVSDGYVAKTKAEIIRLAMLNATVRQMVNTLGDKMSMGK